MALFKCKMCGGDLEIAEGVTIAECEYCGTKQTVPKAMDENLQNLFNRANTLRIKSEFDKAEKLYEKIIQADTTQSEAYWGLILCKYGIEYVDDPATFKKIPTCHRASYDSIIADDDYKSAIENADLSQRAIYEEQAKEIDRIQKDILALAQKEETYDVFICYKETDADGHRTQDSVIANDIYYQLTQEGFKVFYAAITLEGKLGSAYEPIIFAALNSAKVMLSIGTKPEYFNAVWVKNEWSRFLKIIKKDRSKLLIPCYRDMDAYELPEEFAHLQAQDMAKIGFINDLVRGIKKVVKKDEPKQGTVVKETVVTTTNATVAPLLKRAFMFLEDGEFSKADDFCEQVLNQDPENAQAYLGKLMAELHVKKQDRLKDQAEPFDDRNNYQKSVRFADEKLKTILVGYIEHINTRNENARLDGIYTRAKNAMATAHTESTYKEAASLFESISEYQDSATLAQACYEKAEADRLEKERKAEIERKEAERIAKRNKKIAIITTPIVCAVIAFIIVLNTVIIPNGKYNNAIALMDAGKYGEAILVFEALEGYKDSVTKIDECNTAINEDQYNAALKLMDEKKYVEAIAIFELLDGYRESISKIYECNYQIAYQNYSAGFFDEAISILQNISTYSGAQELLNDSLYAKAQKLYSQKNYSAAYKIFKSLGTYKDSSSIMEKYVSVTIDEIRANPKNYHGIKVKVTAALCSYEFDEPTYSEHFYDGYLLNDTSIINNNDSNYGFWEEKLRGRSDYIGIRIMESKYTISLIEGEYYTMYGLFTYNLGTVDEGKRFIADPHGYDLLVERYNK